MRSLFTFSRLTFFVLLTALLAACSSTATLAPATPRLVYIRADASGTPILVAQADALSTPEVLPFVPPADCSVYRLYPNPVGAWLAVEYVCASGQTVLVYDLASGETVNPAASLQTDSHFLAWSADGLALYFKVDLFADTRLVRYELLQARLSTLDTLSAYVYDLAGLTDGRILYSLSPGIGFGSETWIADENGKNSTLLFSDPANIVAYLRPSPDGTQIAYILLPDSQVPFPNGELWLVDMDGENARYLADADAGHGFAPAWSPDGAELAFVVRENASDPAVEQSAATLLTNVTRLQVQSGAQTPVSAFTDAIVESPSWSPDGAGQFFNVVRNGTIQVWFAGSGTPQPLSETVSCCAVWVPGK